MDFDRYYKNRNDSFGLKYNKLKNKINIYTLDCVINGEPAYCGTIFDTTLEEWDNMSEHDKSEFVVTKKNYISSFLTKILW